MWPHDEAVGEKPNRSYTHQIGLVYHEGRYPTPLLMTQLQILIDNIHKGHLGRPVVTMVFFAVIHD